MVNNVQTRRLFPHGSRKANRIERPRPPSVAGADFRCGSLDTLRASFREKPVNPITFCELF
jgi:hypothetical protein